MRQCDCWTDARGYWQLGPNCLLDEMDEWRCVVDSVPAVIEMLNKKRLETDDTTS